MFSGLPAHGMVNQSKHFFIYFGVKAFKNDRVRNFSETINQKFNNHNTFGF